MVELITDLKNNKPRGRAGQDDVTHTLGTVKATLQSLRKSKSV
jgi:hypothetical protein